MSARSPRFEPRVLAPEGTPAGDLLVGEGEVRALLPGLPADAGALRELAGTGPARLSTDAFGTTGVAARGKLERILAGEGVLVSTGQQPDLFLGPLYVLYKALGAAALAAALEERSGIPVLGMFWVASDDHDWAEVGRTRVLDPEGGIREVRLAPPPGREGRAVGLTETPDGIEDRIGDLFQHLPDSDFRSVYLELVRDTYRPGRRLGEAFGELLGELLPEVPLAWLDSGAVRASGAELFARAVREREEVARALRTGEERVSAAGYEAQLHRRSGGIPVFLDGPDGRTRLLAGEGGGVKVGSDGPERAEEEILAELEEHPERFSPNVALRPVLESWLLPVAAVVLGPSETAYWAELPPLFRWADVPLPAVRPRPSWTLVETKVEKVLEKVGADPAAFSDGGRSLSERVTDEGLPEKVRSALAEARRSVGGAFGRLEEAVEEELPGVRGSVGSARHGAFEALDGLEKSVRERVRERQGILLDQIEKAARHLYPGGEPQERVVSPFYYLARYDSAFVEAAREAASGWAEGEAGDVAAPEGAR
ncbi:MAG TPA: bacillithiol biosynthesis cysteine-adding enzyme BshC [Gemmatimonadota bacterium]|nr:bacillithiol biosynthesis cysteine-adding enzyme BshC [Gemmatimonadota bacterium]